MRRRDLLALLPVLAPAVRAAAAPTATADGLGAMRRVNARPRGRACVMRLELSLRDEKRGVFQKSVAMSRRLFPTGYRTRYLITAPEHELGIALLLSEDDAERGMWMYFPASQRRIRVASRGLSALASDFTCEDLLAAVALPSYAFRTVGRDRLAGRDCVKVEMTPANERLRQELGFESAVGWVREDIWLIARADYTDAQGNVFRSFAADDVESIQGVWTPRRFSMDNRRARHATEVRVTEVEYLRDLPAERFSPERFHEEG